MSHSAEDIARVLIQKYIELDNPTTNMKLQKMLYYSWVNYYKETKEYLFSDKIYAWKFGPVVDSVYYNYRIFAAMPITKVKVPDEEIEKYTVNFLSDFAKENKDRTAGGLVFSTHQEGTPWSKVYKEGEKNTVIPFDLIIDIECSS